VHRNAALEAAIVAAPDDLAARLVYGDWLQGAGDIRGEWVTLSASVDATPTPRLRAAAVAFFDRHRRALLGEGAALLPAMWIGWRAGFIDELRLVPFDGLRGYARAVLALLAHPSCRFVRHVAFGVIPDVEAILAALCEQAPPLLESLLVDANIDVAAIATLPALRRLGLRASPMTVPLPELVELCTGRNQVDWIVSGGCPALAELVLRGRGTWQATAGVAQLVAALPRLRRLRLLDVRGVDGTLAALTSHAARLELIDISRGDLSGTGVSELLRWPAHVKVRALGCELSELQVAELRERFGDLATGESWIAHRVRTDGRAALRLVPGVGLELYNAGTNLSVNGREAEALPLLEAAVTLPAEGLDTWAWANVALAHERLGHFDDAELFGREGLLRAPREPNFYAIVLDALRRSGRNAEAEKLLLRAERAIATGSSRHAGGTAAACLLDCLFVLAQAGRHRDLLAMAKRHAKLVDDKRRPSVAALRAMSLVALGRRREARAVTQGVRKGPHVVIHHARAVMNVARPAVAIAELAKAKAGRYPEWHWIAVDPNLAPLRTHPDFIALVSGAGVEAGAATEVVRDR